MKNIKSITKTTNRIRNAFSHLSIFISQNSGFYLFEFRKCPFTVVLRLLHVQVRHPLLCLRVVNHSNSDPHVKDLQF